MSAARRRSRKPWFVDFFEGDYTRFYAGARKQMLSPERSDRDVAFIVESLGLRPGDRVLDLCCGHGRHSVRLAQRGFRVTGLDLSTEHLRLAHAAGKDAGVSVQWVRSDMRRIPSRLAGRFDAVMSMFTSIGYFSDPADDDRVAAGMARSLRPGGKLLIETMNREWMMRHYQPRDWLEHAGRLLLWDRRFDFATNINHEEFTIIDPDGRKRMHKLSLRVFTLAELVSLLARHGLRYVRAWGDSASAEYTSDSPRLILLAERTTPVRRTRQTVRPTS